MRSFVLVVLLLASGLPAGAATKIALEGEASPGGHGLFTVFSGEVHPTEAGHVVFSAATDGPVPSGATTAGCIFRFTVDGGNGAALLCHGDAVGLPGATTWTDLHVEGGELDVDGAGALVFLGTYLDGMGASHTRSFHRSAAGVLTDLGDLVGEMELNEAGDVLADGPDIVITRPGAAITTVLVEGQVLPDEPGRVAADSWASIGPNRQVAIGVEAPVTGGGFRDWVVYLWDDGVFTRIGTNTFGPFTAHGGDEIRPHYTPGGRLVVFLDDGVLVDGIVEWTGDAWVPVVLTRPGELIAGDFLAVDTAGLSGMSFTTAIDAIGIPVRVVLGTGPFAREPMLQFGDVLPEGTVFGMQPPRISTTHWGIRVRLDSVFGPHGVFVGRTRTVALLDDTGVLALVVVLASAAALRLRPWGSA